jgi:hypothetical protein
VFKAEQLIHPPLPTKKTIEKTNSSEIDILIIFYSESNWPTYIWLLAEVSRLENANGNLNSSMRMSPPFSHHLAELKEWSQTHTSGKKCWRYQ